MLYYLFKVHNTYKKLPSELVLSVVLSISYFSITAKMLYAKVKEAYRLLIQNKKLIKEMKKILETFPHGVVIHSRPSSLKEEIHFSNHEFNEHIYEIKQNIRELNKVKVSLVKKNSENEEIGTDLHKFLKKQEKKLKDRPVLQKNNVKINCSEALEAIENNSSQNFEDDSSNEHIKNFNVKTLKVNWEGNENSYMHVFFDVSDIIKLEKAKEDMR